MTETFAHLTVGLAIFDRNQTLALFNPALVQMWQLEPAWLARRPSLRDIVDELRASRRLPELQDFHTWRSELLDLFDNTEAADYEELWHLSNGSNIRVLARPHPHGSLAFIFDDVTERMRLEQRYRHSIDLRRVTLDRLNEGIAVFGSNGLLQFVNQSFHEVWGTNSENIYAAMHVRQFISMCQRLSPDKDVWKGLRSFVTAEHNRREWDSQVSTHSGHVLNARIAPLPDGSTMAVFTNITDSRRASIRIGEKSFSLRFALAAREYVADRIDQEIHVPLARLENKIGAIGQENAEHSDLATEMGEHIERVEGLSKLLRSTAETNGAAPISQDLGSILDTAGNLLKNAATRSDIELKVDAQPDVSGPVADEHQMHQIAFALGLYAIERSSSPSCVTLSVESDDNGCGIVAEIRSQVDHAVSASTTDLDRNVLEHLVARQNGVLSVSETKAAGTARIVARFDRDANNRAAESPDDALEVAGDRSNVLHLPSVATRD